MTEQARALAVRLRALRTSEWPELKITQAALAKALGVAGPSISSWEKESDPTAPPPQRLIDYATFFATRRSVRDGRARLVSLNELTETERSRRGDLEQELLNLRAAAVGESTQDNLAGSPVSTVDRTGGLWHFPNRRPVTIVCAELPAGEGPTPDPLDPEYSELYVYADIEALLELYGYLRAVNPDSEIRIRLASAMTPGDLTNHLVLIGGVDWNVLTRNVLAELKIPVRQVPQDGDPARGVFKVTDGDASQSFAPELRDQDGRKVLSYDVAHFFRGPNPFNQKRTITICNGMFGRGTYGVVRALTDPSFRDRNADYIHRQFPASHTFSILSRVRIVGGGVVTPDWNLDNTRLHEWQQETNS